VKLKIYQSFRSNQQHPFQRLSIIRTTRNISHREAIEQAVGAESGGRAGRTAAAVADGVGSTQPPRWCCCWRGTGVVERAAGDAKEKERAESGDAPTRDGLEDGKGRQTLGATTARRGPDGGEARSRQRRGEVPTAARRGPGGEEEVVRRIRVAGRMGIEGEGEIILPKVILSPANRGAIRQG
jgi:hypothetical protein